MNFHIMTLFPEMIEAGMNTSIIGRAIKAGLLKVNAVNIREYSDEIHGQADDYPYGGGAGMVMQAQPIYDCFRAIVKDTGSDEKKNYRVLYTSPAGRLFDQAMARELALEENVIILCGHYEGVDQRALDLMEAEEVSIGDYVLTGGELPAMVMVDAISRMVPGVLTNADSGVEESFSDGLLEYPQYTRPQVYMGLEVPEILLSGHHANIEKWRREQSLQRTKERRPDLLEK
ncbi:MAG: tRNA (guanosine(37)-N1)-methyltransferase TrmD [Parasporobacterium sp.]|nr:tRNA (guanosine(37)-N1)-methyltransferase TrmD [Parasporobacterium sp.]